MSSNFLQARMPSWLGILVYREVTSMVHRIVPGSKSVTHSILLIKSVVSLTKEAV